MQLDKLKYLSIFLVLIFCKDSELREEKKIEDFGLRRECYIKSEKKISDMLHFFYRYGDMPLLSVSLDSEPRYFLSQKKEIDFIDFESSASLVKNGDEIISIDGCIAKEVIYEMYLPEMRGALEILRLGYISKLDYFLLNQRKSTEIKIVILERNGKRIKYNFPMKNSKK